MKKRNLSAPSAYTSELHAPMQTPVPVASSSTPSVVLTCSKCATDRPGQPFETHHNVGGQTHAHCGTCREVKVHRVRRPGDPAPKGKRSPGKQGRSRRKAA